MQRMLPLLLSVLMLGLGGCATYSHDQLTPVKQWPLATTHTDKPSVYLNVTGEHQFNGKATGSYINSAQLTELVRSEYQGSQQFEQIRLDQQESDLYVSVQFTNQETGNLASAFITGLTLFIIPGTASNTLTMETEFKDSEGRTIGKVVKRETLTTWMQLFLIFAVPFNESADEVLRQITRSSLEEAAQKGFLNGKAS